MLNILMKRTLIKFFIIMASKLYLILLILNYSHPLKVEKKLLKLIEIYKDKVLPTFPIECKNYNG